MPSTFHNELMTDLDAAQQSGALTYVAHRQMRERLRRANMGGAQFTSLAQLCDAVGVPRIRGRFAGRFYH